jgi:hypothetical protein
MPRECEGVLQIVIARLDRAIQYSRGIRRELMGRGVLDHPLAAFARASASPTPNPGEALAKTGRG